MLNKMANPKVKEEEKTESDEERERLENTMGNLKR